MNKVQFYKRYNYDFISVKTSKLKVVLCSLGASMYEIYYDNKLMNMSPNNLKNFIKENEYFGRTIGRVANRIKDAKVIINNKEYLLEANENNNTLHGGYHNISNKNFRYEVIETELYTQVNFEAKSNDLEAGFPGDLTLKVSYIIKDNNIEIKYYAKSSKDTVCSLTNHAYYHLNSEFKDLSLTIKASKYTYPNPKDLCGETVKEVNECLDFRNEKLIIKDINNSELINSRTNGYDHGFIFTKNSKTSPQVILKSSEYIMNIFTSFSGVQVYTDNYPNNIKYKHTKGIKNRAIALEPQDSLLDSHLLKANKEYKRYIKLVFDKI